MAELSLKSPTLYLTCQ